MKERVKQEESHILPDGRMDTRSASAYLGLSQKTLAMMRCRGTGPPFIKLGRIFYYQEDVDAWVALVQRVTSTAEARQRSSKKTQAALKRRERSKRVVKRKKAVKPKSERPRRPTSNAQTPTDSSI